MNGNKDLHASNRKIELLAPAKNLTCGIAAINAGADALYVGAAQFSARANAGNSIQEISQLLKYAAPFGVKIYAALNTLLFDSELAQARALVHQLYEIGVDALIIQDMALLEMDLPPIPIHASTQTHNTSVEKVAFLQNAGVERVILARELSISQITEIRKNTDVELESFVHGALCVSYSGQCYMSYAVGGRSGNRGVCAQPCRKRYSLLDADGNILIANKHLLSLKDLHLADSLAEMLQAGVTSFKIEGRLKDADYVMNITAYYRQLLDALLTEQNMQKSSVGEVHLDFQPNPVKSFNRGFSKYFISGQQQQIAAIHSPKSIGEEIGRVTAVRGNVLAIQTLVELHAGDGLAFFDAQQEMSGMRVNRVEGAQIFLHEKIDIAPGTIVFRNYDHAFQKQLANSKTTRKINVRIEIRQLENGLQITGTAANGAQAEIALNTDLQPAENQARAEQVIEQQFAKMGDSIFQLESISLLWDEAFFLPMSVLNQARRDLITALQQKSEIKSPSIRKILPKLTVNTPRSVDFTGNVLNAASAKFYQKLGIEVKEPAAESGLDLHGRKVMTTRYCIKKELGLCPRDARQKIAEPLFLLDEQNKKFRLEFNCGVCEMSIYYEK